MNNVVYAMAGKLFATCISNAFFLLSFQPSEELKLLELEGFFYSQLEELTKEKERRQALYKQLKDNEKELCGVLGMAPTRPPSNCLLTDELDALTNHIAQLKKERVSHLAADTFKQHDLYVNHPLNCSAGHSFLYIRSSEESHWAVTGQIGNES